MPPLSASLNILREHIGLGVVAAGLFVAGLVTAVPVVRNEARWLMAVPLWIFRQVLRLIGPDFPPVRTFLVIFVFNGTAIFLYMLSGVLIVLPAAVAFLTGLNIGVAVLKAEEVVPAPQRRRPAPAEGGSEGGLWVGVCSLAVLVLELPSFWLSVGMGIGLGRQLGRAGQLTLGSVRVLLEPRVGAYVSLILPALLVSALAETAAIRGHLRDIPQGRTGERPEADPPPDDPEDEADRRVEDGP